MKELSFEEMEMIIGGSWLSNAWNWIKGAAEDIAMFVGSWFRDNVAEAAAEYVRKMNDFLMRGGTMF